MSRFAMPRFAMPRFAMLVFASLVFTPLLSIGAADYRVEKIAEAPEGVAKEIGEKLATDGIRIIKGTSRTVCRIWLCKSWDASSAKRREDVLYPFEPGQLIGVIQYPRKGADFRDQSIGKGTYVMRYGHQPEDGAHEGTFPTRDFLLLLPASADKNPGLVKPKQLIELSMESADGGHPAMLCLQKPSDGDGDKLRHDEEHDWWIAAMKGTIKEGKKSQSAKMALIVVGIAEE